MPTQAARKWFFVEEYDPFFPLEGDVVVILSSDRDDRYARCSSARGVVYVSDPQGLAEAYARVGDTGVVDRVEMLTMTRAEQAEADPRGSKPFGPVRAKVALR